MCGIFGYTGGKNKRVVLRKMYNTIKHRGPDEKGFYYSKGMALGIARLSIVDLLTGSQPFFNESGTIVVVGNGEIYNYRKLKSDLIKRGHLFKTNSDIEIVPHLYEELGKKFITKLVGMFGLAIWDNISGKLLLARDSAGIKPLYYYSDKKSFAFASEIKSILQVITDPKVNKDEIFRVFAYRSSSSNSTCFKHIHKVPAGHILELLQDHQPKLSPFKPKCLYSLNKNRMDTVQKLYIKSIKSCLSGDVPIGAFLSGGLDSGLNVAIMKKFIKDKYKLHTFTVGYGIKGDEFDLARLTANFVKSNHHEIIVKTSDIINDISKIIWHMDEPILDPAFIPTYYLAKEAAKYVKAIIVGDGADEVFAGYDKHLELLQTWQSKHTNPYNFIEKRMPFNFQQLRHLKIPVTYKTFNKLIITMKRAKSADEYVKEGMYIDRVEMLPNLQLMKIDKATMAHGLEARVPFMDPQLVFSASQIPIENLIGKQPLRRLGSSLLPKEIYNGKKIIFFVPIDLWMEQGLDKIANGIIINSSFLPKILNRENLIKELPKLDSYQKWSLMVIDLWQEQFFKNRATF